MHAGKDQNLSTLLLHIFYDLYISLPYSGITRSVDKHVRLYGSRKEYADVWAYRKSSSEISKVPIAPRSAARATWSGPYHARISSVPSILKNLREHMVSVQVRGLGLYIEHTCLAWSLLWRTSFPSIDLQSDTYHKRVRGHQLYQAKNHTSGLFRTSTRLCTCGLLTWTFMNLFRAPSKTLLPVRLASAIM